jgi:hypothetical protein
MKSVIYICVSQYRANVFPAKVWLVRRSLKFDEMVLSIQDDLHRVSIFVQVDQAVHLYSWFRIFLNNLCLRLFDLCPSIHIAKIEIVSTDYDAVLKYGPKIVRVLQTVYFNG